MISKLPNQLARSVSSAPGNWIVRACRLFSKSATVPRRVMLVLSKAPAVMLALPLWAVIRKLVGTVTVAVSVVAPAASGSLSVKTPSVALRLMVVMPSFLLMLLASTSTGSLVAVMLSVPLMVALCEVSPPAVSLWASMFLLSAMVKV